MESGNLYNISSKRTIKTITNFYQFHKSQITNNSNITKLNKTSCSCVRQPLLNILVLQIIPPTLHIIHGIGIKLLALVEKEAKYLDCVQQVKTHVPAIELIYKQSGASRQAYYQTFTCNNYFFNFIFLFILF